MGYKRTEKQWGALIPTDWHESPAATVDRNFKLLLSNEMLSAANGFLRGHNAPEVSPDDVETMFSGFLSELYKWITPQLEKAGRKPFKSMRVEFLFSIPTTWDRKTVDKYRDIITRAGYGEHPGHKADIGVNEAMAAAVHTALYRNDRMSNVYKVIKPRDSFFGAVRLG
jgi:hypothetical protein